MIIYKASQFHSALKKKKSVWLMPEDLILILGKIKLPIGKDGKEVEFSIGYTPGKGQYIISKYEEGLIKREEVLFGEGRNLKCTCEDYIKVHDLIPKYHQEHKKISKQWSNLKEITIIKKISLL